MLMKKAELDRLVNDLPEGPFQTLGQGVWGTVLDLGDGTVLKLSKKVGGIGDGLEKCRQEVRVLEALAQRKSSFSQLSFPELNAHGEIDPSSHFGQQGFAYWMRMSKLHDPVMSDERLDQMSVQEQEAFANSVASAIAEFHAAFDANPVEPQKRPFIKEYSLDQLKSYTTNRNDCDAADTLKDVFGKLFDTERVVYGHGDLNFGNMTVNAKGEVTGLLDFAETSYTLPEAEFCHFRIHDAFSAAVVGAYRAKYGALSEKNLDVCAANNALFGAVITEFCLKEDKEHADFCRNKMNEHLKKAGLQ